ncbi:hypothetical protein [Brevibacillus laterosporus]|uniref:hypothetical protein n=1 Tax=Brevibacillus laterosporus TaxID=1465 RepID=UPI003D247C63
MANKKYVVIADFVDEITGNTVHAGSVFEADEPRAERGKEAKVLGDEVKKETSKSKNNDPKPSTEVAPEAENQDVQQADDQGEK